MRDPRQGELSAYVLIPNLTCCAYTVLHVLFRERGRKFLESYTAQAKRLITAAVTDWIVSAEGGKKSFGTNGHRFNIWDLEAEVGPGFDDDDSRGIRGGYESLTGYLKRKGIIGLKIVTRVSDELHHGWTSDDKLYDSEKVDRAFAGDSSEVRAAGIKD